MSIYSDQIQTYDSLPDLSWLTGIWIGSESDQYSEEHWSQAVSQQLMGMFRMLQSDKPVFYEFMTIGIEEQKVTLSIKHFNPGLIGWESKDQVVKYDVVQENYNGLVLFKRHAEEPNWMVYQRTGDRLTVYFVDSTGEVEGSRFNFEWTSSTPD